MEDSGFADAQREQQSKPWVGYNTGGWAPQDWRVKFSILVGSMSMHRVRFPGSTGVACGIGQTWERSWDEGLNSYLGCFYRFSIPDLRRLGHCEKRGYKLSGPNSRTRTGGRCTDLLTSIRRNRTFWHQHLVITR
jgi:hypothetical protein